LPGNDEKINGKYQTEKSVSFEEFDGVHSEYKPIALIPDELERRK
jgi:hypothetical protein